MSDEREQKVTNTDDEVKLEDVEAHVKVANQTDEDGTDSDDDVEAHQKAL